ncbi:MAG: amidohydrolase family protein, partial [Dehalococcoidia bacterium]|nr:amidohydrolase family protein [Dehalococcoidia bacterium]
HVSEPVGHQYPGKGAVTPEQPYGLAKAFPEAAFVCAHWGGGLPFYALMPEVRSVLANVYFDSAASQYLYRPEVFETVIRIVGKEHVLFGSDFPLIRQRRALEHVRSASLSQTEQAALVAENAERLLTPGETCG